MSGVGTEPVIARAAATAKDQPGEHAIVVYDGVCNLCSATVRFIIRRDRAGYFRFAALQSEQGRALLAPFGLPARDAGSIVVLAGGRAFTRSSASVRIARRLRWPWPALGALLWLVPRPLRNAGYDLVARHRYRWFGRQDRCERPPPELRERFL